MNALLLLIGCASPVGSYSLPDTVVIDAVVLPNQELRVTVQAPATLGWTLDEPSVQGLSFTSTDERHETVGEHTLTTRTWSYQGPPRSYVIGPICAATDAGEACADPLYVDVGVRPDRSQMTDIVEPHALWPELPWAGLLAGIAVLGAAVGAAWWWVRREPPPSLTAIDDEPAHVAALRRWSAVRDDDTLTDFDKAQALSEIFRTYVETTLRFPARSWTTTETLDHLTSLNALPQAEVPRARRLLRATDRVKYAEMAPGSRFFGELEADLRAFIDATRPHEWQDTVEVES